MSPLKFRFPLSAPQRADRSLLPGVLASLLATLLVVQIVVPVESEIAAGVLPPVRAPRFSDFAMTASADPAPILARPLFAPRLSMIGTGQGPTQVLGGASVAGTMAIRGRTVAIVRRADGSVRYLSPGGVIDGWRLVGLTSSGARFQKGAERLELPFGAASVATPEDMEASEDGDE